MQAYIDRNISVCLHFYCFRHTKKAPSTFMDKRSIEIDGRTNLFFVQRGVFKGSSTIT